MSQPSSSPNNSSLSSSSSSESSSSDSQLPVTPPNQHQNTINPDSRWIVQKYGGTSVGKFPVKIARDIVANYIDRHKVAIVCSARSGSTKSLGTTSLLLRAASEALKRPKRTTGSSPGAMTPITRGMFSQMRGGGGGSGGGESTSLPGSPGLDASGRPPSLTNLTSMLPNYSCTVDLIRQQHIDAARESVRDPVILQELEAEIDKDCEWLRSFLFAAQVIDEISPRSKDSIIGLGERLACKIMTAVLRDQGIDAEYVSLENIVPEVEDNEAFYDETLDQEFYDRLAVAVAKRVMQCGPRVPVVTGFFGPVPGSLLCQVGRGYTDLLSALLSVGLKAAELQIWKEVDGIYTADPRKVMTARLINYISPDEAAELTYYGSEVVHAFAMEQVRNLPVPGFKKAVNEMDQAIREMIPIRVKNVVNPNGSGTVIIPGPKIDNLAPTQDERSTSDRSSLEELSSLEKYLDTFNLTDENGNKRLPTAVTIKDNIIVLNVHSNRKSVSHGFLAGIFGTLDRFGVVVDLISTSEVHVSMAIESGPAVKKFLDKLVADLRKSGTVSVHHEMAILSLVGRHMKNLVGMAGRMFTTLAQGNVNIEMISQGASEINISCVIEEKDSVLALNLIHQSCLQIRPEGAQGRMGPWLF